MRNKHKLIELAYESSLLYAQEFPGEDFHPDYKKDKDIFRMLIKSDRKIEKNFNKYFGDLAERCVAKLIDWVAYQNKQLQASEIDDWIQVDWSDEALTMKVFLTESLVDAIVAGGLLMELDSKIDIGWNKNAPTVMDFIDKYALKLAKGLNETTEDRIKSALKLSISNGETTPEARSRITEVIDDPKRSATIARTESVKAFGAGRKAVAEELGWAFKEWHTTIAPCEICKDLPKYGRIPIDKKFGDYSEEPAHPNCRCSVRYFKDEK